MTYDICQWEEQRMKFLEEKFVPLAAALGTQRHLAAIRDAFVVIMPVSIVGAVSVLANNIHQLFGPTGLNVPAVYNGYKNFLASSGLGDVFTAINKGSISMMAILLVAALGYTMAQGLSGDGIATSIVAMTCYLGLVPAVQSIANKVSWETDAKVVEVATGDIASGAVAANKLDSNGMFVGMLLTIVVAEIFVRLSRNDKLKITLPDGVPPAVANSFTVLIPAIITVIGVVLVGTYIVRFTGQNIWDIITKFVSAPLSSVADTLGTAVLSAFLVNFLWIFGLHGANIIGAVTTPVFTPMLLDNTEKFQQGLEAQYIAPGMNVFNTLGGSGCTIGLIIAILLFGKVQSEKTVIGISVAPGIFEINEPITFGVPIVMNPIYMLPFVAAPVLMTILAYTLTKLGIIEKVVLSTPWVTPPVLWGFLATGGGIKAMIFHVIELVLLTLIWTPFVMMSNKQNG